MFFTFLYSPGELELTLHQAATTSAGSGGSTAAAPATTTSAGVAAQLAGPAFGGVAGLLALAFL